MQILDITDNQKIVYQAPNLLIKVLFTLRNFKVEKDKTGIF